MDLNFYSDLTDGTGQSDAEFLDAQSFNGFDTDNKFPGGSDNYLTISGSGHPFLSSSESCEVHVRSESFERLFTMTDESRVRVCATKTIDLFSLAGPTGGTFHTPSLGDEEFEIPPISLDPDSALSVSDVVSHFGELPDPGPSDSVVVPENSVVEGDDPSFASTFVNPSAQGLEHLGLSVMNQSAGSSLLGATLGMDLGHPMGSQFSSSSPVTIDVPLGDMGQGLLGSNQLTTIDQSELSTHLGLGLGGGTMLPRPQSPEHPLSATASPTSSLQDDDMDDFRRSVLVESPVSLAVSPGVISLDPSLSDAPISAHTSTVSHATGRKGGGAGKKGKKKKDPNEPQKPVSAYALFFRDTQAAIKGQNPNATFGEVSKIVASMWDSLGEEQKQVYKRKNEAAKKDYLKSLAEYKAGQLNQTPIKVMDTSPSPPPPAPAPVAPAVTPAPRPTRSQHYNPEENTITNICTSNIIVDLPQVTTRSRTGAIKPPPPTTSPPPPPAPNPPAVTKIIIKSTPLPSGGVSVTATPAPSTRQPPPLSAPPPPRLQQMVHAQAPPPLQAKPRGGGATTAAAAMAPPPLQIKVVPSQSSGRQASSASLSSADAVVVGNREKAESGSVTVEVGGSAAAVVTKTEDGADAEEGMEVEVNVAPGPTVTPAASPNICVRAGCTNQAVESKDWDKEYCSNECVATHCRDVFMAWCAIRGQNSTTVT